MTRIIAIAIMISGVLFSFAYAAEKPRVLLFERNPWLMVIGSDSPIFVLYESGTVIYWDEKEGWQGAYKTVHLENSSVQDLVKNQSESLKELKDNYDVFVSLDEPAQDLYFFEDGKSRTIHVNGSLKDKESRKNAPEALLNVYDNLTSFDHEDAEIWTPEYIEVMIWPYERAPDESIMWPEKWPDINSTSTRKRRRDAYSIYLPFEEREALNDFLRTKKEKGAVLMNNRKWTISLRTPFPHELPPDL